MKKLSIIVPVFNEQVTILKTLKRLQSLELRNWSLEVVIINDGSTDNTTHILQNLPKSPNLKILHHKINKGKGAAIQTALTKCSGDAIVIQDADLEYDPKDLKKMIIAYEQKGGLILGSRNLKPKRQGYKLFILGDWILTSLVNILYDKKLTDIYSGYKLLSLKDAKSLNLQSNGFEIEMELIIKTLKKNITTTEIPITYSPRSFKEGKKIKWTDGIKGLITLVKFKII